MFIGEHEATLDAKNRVVFPAKLRDAVPPGERDRFVCTIGLDGCLFLYTKTGWDKVVRALEERVGAYALGSTDLRRFQRAFYSRAEPCELDKQGRFLLPQKLRQEAAIDREVVFVGVSDRVELWDARRWAAAQASTGPDEFVRLGEQIFQGRPT